MALCRVFTNDDGTVRVMYPNPRLRGEKESEADFVKRICTRDQARDESLKGLTFTDIDHATLPSRETRDAWVMTGKAVAVDAKLQAAIVESRAEAGAVNLKGA